MNRYNYLPKIDEENPDNHTKGASLIMSLHKSNASSEPMNDFTSSF